MLKFYWCTYLVEVYPHTKLHQNLENFFLTDNVLNGRMDKPELHSVRSLVGADLKIKECYKSVICLTGLDMEKTAFNRYINSILWIKHSSLLLKLFTDV